MTGSKIFFVAVGMALMLVACLAIPKIFAEDAAPPAVQAAPIEKWEYGDLTVTEFSPSNTALIWWGTANGEISSIKPDEKNNVGGFKDTFAQAMSKVYSGVAAQASVKNIPKECGTYLAIYNLLGSLGWEYVSKETVAEGPMANMTTIIFKRRIP